VLAYSLSMGLANPQGALLEPGLANLGAGEDAAGWTNAGAQLASLLVGVAVSAGVDALKARARWLHKAALVGSVMAAGLCFSLYAAAFAAPLASSNLALAVAIASFVAANAFVGAAIPLLFDSAAERAFGKGPEGAMLMGLVLPLNVVTLAVLAAPASTFFSWINVREAPPAPHARKRALTTPRLLPYLHPGTASPVGRGRGVCGLRARAAARRAEHARPL
jgi:hypothetical protein